MLIYPQGSDVALRGDLVLRAVLRTDLTPVPATVELEGRRCDEVDKAFVEGAIVRVGKDRTEFELVKVQDQQDEGLVQGSRPVGKVKAVGILAACAPIAKRLQRAVIRESATLGDIYRACGAQVRIDSDFTVPVFSAFVGMVPSFAVAQALQEEAGVLIYSGGKIMFRRLGELQAAAATLAVPAGVTQVLESGFLERHAVPFAISTGPDGASVIGHAQSSRGAVYRPRADQRIVNNLSTALVQRRKLRHLFSPMVNAGHRIDVDSQPNIVITAAHVYETGDAGGVADMYSQFWLGELVK